MKIYKNALVLFICICMGLIGSNLAVQASTLPDKADLVENGLKYYIQKDKSTVSVKIQNKNKDVVIPETVEINKKSYTVTRIESTAIKHDTLVMDKQKRVARDNKEYFKNTKTKSISIPKTIRSIETGAFSYFTKLKKVVVAKENVKYSSTSKGLFSKNGKILYLALDGKGTYKVKSGVEKIAARAFVGTKYKKVILPDSCSEVGTRAFFKCKNLKTIKGSSLCICGKYAFYGTKVKGIDNYGTMKFRI